MNPSVASCVSALAALIMALPAHAATDFNSSRSNRERGTLAVSPPASSPSEEAAEAQQGENFNSARSNKEKRGMRTTNVHGDPHVDQISVDEPGMPSSSSTRRVLPTVNKRSTSTSTSTSTDADQTAPEPQQAQDFNTTRSNKEKGALSADQGGPDQDCDGVTCPASTPARGKGGKTGHVTILK